MASALRQQLVTLIKRKKEPNNLTETSFAGVRFATPPDEDALLALLTLAHAENGLFTQDDSKVRAMIRRATEHQGGMIGVIDGASGLEGVIVMVLSQFWYSEDWHIEECVNFVHPDHRRSTHARRLLEFAKWIQVQLGVPLLAGILTLNRLEPKMRLYQRQLPQVGAVFQHGLTVSDSFNQRHLDASTAAPDPASNGAIT